MLIYVEHSKVSDSKQLKLTVLSTVNSADYCKSDLYAYAMIKVTILHTLCTTSCVLANRSHREQHILIESDYVINSLGNVCSEYMQCDWSWYNKIVLRKLN